MKGPPWTLSFGDNIHCRRAFQSFFNEGWDDGWWRCPTKLGECNHIMVAGGVRHCERFVRVGKH